MANDLWLWSDGWSNKLQSLGVPRNSRFAHSFRRHRFSGPSQICNSMAIVGTGPDGSFQPLRIGPMGGILSLPGAADQAIHADTPHLFEHIDCLPAHYINAFCLGREVTMSRDGSTELGGTAFVHGSHRLSYTAAVGDLSAHLVLDQLVRPSLNLGDVVLFDCRVLHFGLANTSPTLDVQCCTSTTHLSGFTIPRIGTNGCPYLAKRSWMVAM
jgi:hypothetical protein